MVTMLEGILGEHITEGVASVPVGSLETARRQFPQYVPKKDSKIRSVITMATESTCLSTGTYPCITFACFTGTVC